MVILPDLVAQEIDRFEGPLSMFADEIVKFDPAVRPDILDTKGPFLAGPARHYFGPERNLHLGTSP